MRSDGQKKKVKLKEEENPPRMASGCPPPHYETQYPFAAKTKHSDDSKIYQKINILGT